MKQFLIILLIAAGVCATVYDIDSVVVDTSGWYVRIYAIGLPTGGTYDLGVDTPQCVMGTPTVILRPYSYGYNASAQKITRQRTVWGTLPVYDVNPNATSRWETEGLLRIALHEPIYNLDTAVYHTITDGFYINGVDSIGGSNGTVKCVNHSTLDYGRVDAGWGSPFWQHVKTSPFNISAIALSTQAMHGEQIASIVFTATDESSHTYIDTITTCTMTKERPVGTSDSCAVIEYIFPCVLTGLDALDTITVNFQAYPWIGSDSAVLNTADGVNSGTSINYKPFKFWNDKSNTYGTTIAVVGDTTGQGAVGACVDEGDFNPASPPNMYATLYQAINGISAYNNTNHSRNDFGGGIVYMRDKANGDRIDYANAGGALSPSTTPATYLTLQVFPGDNRDSVRITTRSDDNLIGNRLHLKNFTFASTSGNVDFRGFGGLLHIWIDSMSYSSTSDASMYDNIRLYMTNTHLISSNGVMWPYSGGLDHGMPLMRGCYITGGRSFSPPVCVGNIINANGQYSYYNHSNGNNVSKPVIYAFNKAYRDNSQGWNFGFDSVATRNSGSVVQNIFERITSYAGGLIGIVNDNSTVSPFNHLNFSHNNVIGARINMAYNDVVNNGNGPKLRWGWSVKNNILDDINIVTSGDNHGGLVDSTGYGNYPIIHGCGTEGNIYCERVGPGMGSYVPKFYGINTFSHGNTAGTIDPMYTDDKSVAGDDGGYGDYRPAIGSPAIQNTGEYILKYDINGNPRDSLTASGAFAYSDEGEPPAPPPSCTLTISTSTGGTVSPSGAQSDTCGDTLQIIAIPSAGYEFDRWTKTSNIGILDSTDDTTSVWKTDSTNGTVTANFTIIQQLLDNQRSRPFRNRVFRKEPFRGSAFRE